MASHEVFDRVATPTTSKSRYERRRRLEYGTFQLLQRPRDGERLSRSAKVTHSAAQHSSSSSFHSVLPLSLALSSHNPFNSLARIQCANYLLTGDLFDFIQKSALPRPCNNRGGVFLCRPVLTKCFVVLRPGFALVCARLSDVANIRRREVVLLSTYYAIVE